MSNYRRWRVSGGTYFFTAVTYHRRAFLTTAPARRCLRAAFRRTRQLRPFKVLAIVLLPDHLHTVWELPPGDTNYSVRWRQLKTLFTQAIGSHLREEQPTRSRRRRQEHAVWQRRFFEHTCRDEDDLKRCVDYTHVNPVKHRLVERVRDWPWSSFHRYVRLGEYDADWGSSTDWYGDEFRWAE